MPLIVIGYTRIVSRFNAPRLLFFFAETQTTGTETLLFVVLFGQMTAAGVLSTHRLLLLFTIPYHYTSLQIQSNSLLVPQQRRCLKQVGIIVNPLALCPLSLIHHRERLDRTTATITTCHTTAAVGTTIKLVMLQLLEAP